MPFVDLSSPNNQNTGQNQAASTIQTAQDASVLVQDNQNQATPVNTVNNTAQTQQAVAPQHNPSISEEHSLLQNVPAGLIDNTSTSVKVVKGPPLPSQVQNMYQTSGLNNLDSLNVTNTQPVDSNFINSMNNNVGNTGVVDQKPTMPIPIPTNNQDSIPKIPGTDNLPSLESVLGNPALDSIPQAANQSVEVKPKNVNMARVLSNFAVATAPMNDFLAYTIANKASDLHISSQSQAYLRVDGSLRAIPGEPLSSERVKELIYELMDDNLRALLEKTKEVDFSVQHESGDRFRANVFNMQGMLSIALRLIPNKIKTISELGMPEILYDFTKVPHGLVIVTGPTGSGKSTTIAAMIQEINMNRSEHIITIEDPIEYVYPRMRSLIEQREIGKDSLSWQNALRSVLRQDPNIVLVGEMRDYETIEAAVTVAETGHLVFGTLHTNSASQTIDRIIDVFPEGQQSQIRAQLANVITAVVAQRLIPIRGGGRKAVLEIMTGNSAVRNAIREGKTYQIDNIIQTNLEVGMQTLENSLVKLVKAGEVTAEEAATFTVKPDELYALLRGNN